ncbi:hypothetical protein WA026_015316 [Henosepilachna vigintioctopunctata]|uniref:Uncharacterized protein n=1 Tax=Henosepilachna vigintioctopunctata TaxID=420089 RepID=A0AAW1TL02_9CUCU
MRSRRAPRGSNDSLSLLPLVSLNVIDKNTSQYSSGSMVLNLFSDEDRTFVKIVILIIIGTFALKSNNGVVEWKYHVQAPLVGVQIPCRSHESCRTINRSCCSSVYVNDDVQCTKGTRKKTYAQHRRRT